VSLLRNLFPDSKKIEETPSATDIQRKLRRNTSSVLIEIDQNCHMELMDTKILTLTFNGD